MDTTEDLYNVRARSLAHNSIVLRSHTRPRNTSSDLFPHFSRRCSSLAVQEGSVRNASCQSASHLLAGDGAKMTRATPALTLDRRHTDLPGTNPPPRFLRRSTHSSGGPLRRHGDARLNRSGSAPALPALCFAFAPSRAAAPQFPPKCFNSSHEAAVAFSAPPPSFLSRAHTTLLPLVFFLSPALICFPSSPPP